MVALRHLGHLHIRRFCWSEMGVGGSQDCTIHVLESEYYVPPWRLRPLTAVALDGRSGLTASADTNRASW